MFKRVIEPIVLEAIQKYPIVTITGPRQSGKTTLVRELFPEHTYISLEDPDKRTFAQNDPRGFFEQYKGSLILDEIQRCPDLTSYLQTIVDEPSNKNTFILTGSHSHLLVEAVSQSLAGRTQVVELLPFSFEEIQLFNNQPSLNELMYSGGYPRIYDKKLEPTQWLKDYFRLYIERDIRSIFNIKNLDQFERFMALTAGRVGQLINFDSLGSESGVSGPTVKEWLSVLQSSYVCFKLKPHFKNFNKRIVKTPKIYFFDTGLLCYLLGINSPEQLNIHPLRGQIFENFVVSEFYKNSYNKGLEPRYYFWRDQKGHEVDLIKEELNQLIPIEIKLANTFQETFLKNIKYLNKLQNSSAGFVVYSGETTKYKEISLLNWQNLSLAKV